MAIRFDEEIDLNRLALTFVLALVVAALAAALAIAAGMRLATAAPSTLLEQANYTFSCPETNDLYQCDPVDVLPDPAVWTANRFPAVDTGAWCVGGSDSVAQCGWPNQGLMLSDPGYAQLLYTYEIDQLSGNPTVAAHHNTAKFRVVSTADYIPDGPSWSSDSVAWRMILDDGEHRLELKWSRSSTGRRQLSIANSALSPFEFPWDNTMPNTYEIERHASGDFTVTLTNGDPSAPSPTQSLFIPAGMLPASHGAPVVAWGMGLEAGALAGFLEAHLEVNRPTGSVTGKGTIDSPTGAMTDNADATGPARFSVSAKFAKGFPSGQVAFDLKAGGLVFRSSSIDSLLITDTGALILGRGTVNGSGDYRFALRVADGEAGGGTGPDAFHLRIWDPATYNGHNPVYDNQPELDPWLSDATWPLSGGSITLR